MKIRFIYFILILAAWSLHSCSNSRYSGFRQTFVNFTTYYNTYFNIKQKYKTGYLQATKNSSENLETIISPFENDHMPDAFKSVGVFSETAPKTSKLVNKKPISKWVDDALLIEGKIKYNKGDYDSAIQVFEYITSNYKKGFHYNDLEFGKVKYLDKQVKEAIKKKEPIKEIFWRHPIAKNSALIWLARSYTAKNDLTKASSIISYAESDKSFPIQYRYDLAKAKIGLNIASKEYEKALLNISEIFEMKHSKKEHARLLIIQGQLAENLGNKEEALGYYNQALEGRLSNDLEFEAKLKISSLSDQLNANETIDMLKKMLHKGNYQTKLDRIHFAIGMNYVHLKDPLKAEQNFKKTIELSTSNSLKFKAFEAIGDMYYEQKQYLASAKFYDSAALIIPSNLPTKEAFLAKNSSLSDLLKNYNIFIKNDSIIQLVSLGNEGAIAQIEKNIDKQKKESEKNSLNMSSETITPDAKNKDDFTVSKWYFSNSNGVAKGKETFSKKWGKIKLQDNWKKTAGNSTFNNNPEELNPIADNMNNLSSYNIAEIEAKRLPFKKEEQTPFHNSIKSALLAMAKIYHYELKDYANAIIQYELLLERYPTLDYEDEVLYALYLAYIEHLDESKALLIKNKLINKYPQSKFTNYILHPNLKSDEEKIALLANQRYKEAFKAFQLQNYEQTVQLCNSFLQLNTTHELCPKFALLKAYTYSASSMHTDFISTLESLTIQYKGSPEATKAQEILELLKNTTVAKRNSSDTESLLIDENSKLVFQKSNLTREDKAIESIIAAPSKPSIEEVSTNLKNNEEIKPVNTSTEKEQKIVNFYYVANAPHFCLIKLGNSISVKAAKSAIDYYLKNNFNSMNYKVEELTIDGKKILSIGKIVPMEKAYVLNDLLKQESNLQAFIGSSELYIITSSNLDILYMSDAFSSYIDFYRANYRQ